MTLRILSVLSGAGFTFETEKLLEPLADKASFIVLNTWFGGRLDEHRFNMAEYISVPSFPTVTQPSRMQAVRAFWQTYRIALRAFESHRPDLAVVVGCSHAVPVFLAARRTGVATVFVESITRCDQLSLTGKLVRALRLTDLFIVQWPELQKHYPGAQLGSIL